MRFSKISSVAAMCGLSLMVMVPGLANAQPGGAGGVAPGATLDLPKPTDGQVAGAIDAAAAAAKQAADNAKKLAEVLDKAGVPKDAKAEPKTLEGGVIIEDLVVGTGPEVPAGATVTINYHGMLKENGNTFDSSFDRGQPVTFPLPRLIPGWQEGIPGMKEGGVRRLTIPWAKAYGEAGSPPVIPAKADLVFIVQMLSTDGVKRFEEIKEGTGEETVSNLCVVVANQKITDKEGKVLAETAPGKPYIWFPGEMAGLGEQISGMKLGGKRKITLPASMAAVFPGSELKLPANTPVVIELEVVHFRNLPQNPAGPGGPGGPGGR